MKTTHPELPSHPPSPKKKPCWGGLGRELCLHPEHELPHPRGEFSRQVGAPFRVTWYSFLNIPAGGPGLGGHGVQGVQRVAWPWRPEIGGQEPLARRQRRASCVAPTLLSPWSAPSRAPAPHHLGPHLRGARVWEGAAIWAGSRRPWGSDCVRNLRNGAPSHRSTDNRPLARETQARSRGRPAPPRPRIRSERGGAQRRRRSGRTHWLPWGACALSSACFLPADKWEHAWRRRCPGNSGTLGEKADRPTCDPRFLRSWPLRKKPKMSLV